MLDYINEYSIALFEIAKESKKINLFKKQALFLQNTFIDNSNYINLLSSYSINSIEKQKSLKVVFKKNIEPEIYYFLFLLIDKHYIKNINKILNKFIKIIDNENKIINGIVYSTYKLSKIELINIEKKVSLRFQNKINLINKIDQDLLGGIKIIIDNNIIDISIIGLLNEMKHNLLIEKKGVKE